MTAQTPSLKDRQRQERERLILQATEEVLAEKGYDAMSMEEVASRVGISRAAIYLHFPSKEDLVFALLERGARAFADHLDAVLRSAASPREKVLVFIEQSYGGMSHPSFQLFNSILQSPTFFSKVAEKRKTLRDLWGPAQQRLAAVLEEGKRSGDFDPDMPTPLMNSLLCGLLTPISYRRLVEQEHMPPAAVVEHLSHYFLKGIAPDRPSDSGVKAAAEPASGWKAQRAEAIDK